MPVEIEKAFEVDRPPEAAWAFLIDPDRIVECLPGAELVRQVDERTWAGKMGFELGPVGMSFAGEIRFDVLDEEELEVEMSGSGEEADGMGEVTMSMWSRLEPLGDGGTRIRVRQTLDLSGRLAALGGGAMTRTAADMMFDRFTRCVTKKLAEG